jgi:ABC-2 type transport system permease protein
VVGGDLFSAEDRYGTWATLLTRSRSRAELFAGKAITALAFSALAVAVLAVSSILAGIIVVGSRPLIDLSGVLLQSREALTRVVLAWVSVLAPACAFAAMAILVSVATRSSAAGVGLPVLIGLLMQLLAFVDGPEPIRRALITSGFGAWHGLLAAPQYHAPLVYATAVSVLYLTVCLVAAHRLLFRREIGR